MNVNISPHPPTPRVRSINCCRKFTWTLTSHPTPPTPRVRSINCCRKFTWTLTSHPTPPPPSRVCVASTAAASSQRVRSINCCRKFTWTLTSHPTPPPNRIQVYAVPEAWTSLYIQYIFIFMQYIHDIYIYYAHNSILFNSVWIQEANSLSLFHQY